MQATESEGASFLCLFQVVFCLNLADDKMQN